MVCVGQPEACEGGDEIGKMGSGPIPQGFGCSAGDLMRYSHSRGRWGGVWEQDFWRVIGDGRKESFYEDIS